MGIPKSVVTVLVGAVILFLTHFLCYTIGDAKKEKLLLAKTADYDRLRGRRDALRNLYRNGKIHTINYVLGLEELRNRTTNPKSNDLVLSKAEFTFSIDNTNITTESPWADVAYRHTFDLAEKQGCRAIEADFVILHAYGGMRDTYFNYNNNQKNTPIYPEAIPENIGDIPVNRRLARCKFNFGWNPLHPAGKLEFGYRIDGEHSFENKLESFVIYPKNYAAKIQNGMSFQVTYAVKPSITPSIKICKHSVENGRFNMEEVRAEVPEAPDEKTFIRSVSSVDMDCIYFVLVRYGQ